MVNKLIATSIERIKPGVWFTDGGIRPRKMMKLQDILPSGIHQSYIRIVNQDGQYKICDHYVINAVDDKGVACCCPYGMEIFYVESLENLYSGHVGPVVKEHGLKNV